VNVSRATNPEVDGELDDVACRVHRLRRAADMKKTPTVARSPRVLSLVDLSLARGGEDQPKTPSPPPPKPKDPPIYLEIKLVNILIS
jgi:hypothetical protein